MNTSTWTEAHSRVIADGVPQVREADELELARTWGTVRRSLPVSRGGRRRRVLLLAGSALTVATLTVGGVAAAGGFSAHTGEYPSDVEDVRLGGPGEQLDQTASDFGPVVTKAIADIPFANESQRAAVVANLVAEGRRDAGGPDVASGKTGVRESTGAVRAAAAQGAICGWAELWAEATTSGDQAARDAAIAKLDQASTWPAVTAVDPVQKAGTKTIKVVTPGASAGAKSREAVVDDSTQFGYLPGLQKLVAGTDVPAVDAATSVLYCFGVSTEQLTVTNEHNANR